MSFPRPVEFDTNNSGLITGTTPEAAVEVAQGEYDSIDIVNTGGSDIYFSVDGGGSWGRLLPTQAITRDFYVRPYSRTMKLYSPSGAGQCQVALWYQGEELV